MKQCTSCLESMDFSEFRPRPGSTDGFRGRCKRCEKIKYQENLAANGIDQEKKKKERADYNKKWRSENTERIRKQQSKWVSDNKDHSNLKKRQWAEKNHEKVIAARSAWSVKNKEISAQRFKSRLRSDILFALTIRVRNRINRAIYRGSFKKKCASVQMLGCSVEFLKEYLEQRFAPGMTWENRSLWHIDHIIPLSSAKSEIEILELCNYKNLQPLWATDNISKGAKIINHVGYESSSA